MLNPLTHSDGKQLALQANLANAGKTLAISAALLAVIGKISGWFSPLNGVKRGLACGTIGLLAARDLSNERAVLLHELAQRQDSEERKALLTAHDNHVWLVTIISFVAMKMVPSIFPAFPNSAR